MSTTTLDECGDPRTAPSADVCNRVDLPRWVTPDDVNAPQLSWTIATLPAHTGGTIGFAVTVNNDAPEGGIIYNIASFDSDEVVAVQSSRVSHMIGIPPTLIKSHISSAPPQAFGRVQPGDLITYTLAYSNRV
jgi:hypothetical protein